MEDYRESLEKVSSELRLVLYEQDWGIANADYKRIPEFIQYFNRKETQLNEYFVCELTELVIASFNDFLVEGHKDTELIQQFNRFVDYLMNNEKCRKTVSYWKRISQNNLEEFPVGDWLELRKK